MNTENQSPAMPAENASNEIDNTDLGLETPAAEAGVDTPADGDGGAVDAVPAGGADAGAAEIGSEAWLNDPETSPAALRAYMTALDEGKDPVAAVTGEDADVEKGADEDSDEESADGQDAAPAAVLDFKFTENADDETFEKEKTAYLEAVEITPELQTILDRQAAQIESLRQSAASEAFQTDESVQEHMGAFDQIVEFVEDPETGQYVPKTDGLINLLSTKYEQELPRLVIDLNSRESAKYPGMTFFQEAMADNFGLDGPAMQRLNYFLSHNGTLPYPAFVPEGIDQRFTEAFWTEPDREALETELDRIQFTLAKDPDATDEERATARLNLQKLNQRLANTQSGIDYQRSQREAAQQGQKNVLVEVNNAAVDNFINTSRALIERIGATAATGLDMMDGEGATLTGMAFGALIETAFSDNDGYAKYAQEQLAKHGVTADWGRAFKLRDDLFNAEKKIVALERTKGTNPRAIENAKRDKDGIVKELLSLASEAGGKINRKVVASAGAKLTKEIKNSPRLNAVTPRGTGAGVNSTAKPNFEKMSVPEMRKAIAKMQRGENPYAQAVRGDISGFAN